VCSARTHPRGIPARPRSFDAFIDGAIHRQLECTLATTTSMRSRTRAPDQRSVPEDVDLDAGEIRIGAIASLSSSMTSSCLPVDRVTSLGERQAREWSVIAVLVPNSLGRYIISSIGADPPTRWECTMKVAFERGACRHRLIPAAEPVRRARQGFSRPAHAWARHFRGLWVLSGRDASYWPRRTVPADLVSFPRLCRRRCGIAITAARSSRARSL